jgi:Uma2 family endonuclease
VVAHPNQPRMSVEEYLELDRRSPDKRYEYIDGEVYLMAGASGIHEYICANMMGELRNALRGSPCRVYGSNVKLKVAETKYFLPDVQVSCHPADLSTAEVLHHSRLVVEVLSPSTQRLDQYVKSTYYRNHPTIQEYVLVHTDRQFVEVYRRGQNRHWMISSFGPGEAVELESLGVRIPIAEIYGEVVFPLNITDFPTP